MDPSKGNDQFNWLSGVNSFSHSEYRFCPTQYNYNFPPSTGTNQDDSFCSQTAEASVGSYGNLYLPSAEETPPTFTASFVDEDQCEVSLLEPGHEPSGYNYHLKIINPKKRSDFVVRMWHGVSRKFKSPSALRAQIQESFSSDVPSTTDFQVGYLEGNTKHWIVEKRDLMVMYSTFQPSSRITLWCDAKVSEPPGEPAQKKRKTEASTPNNFPNEADSVDLIFKKLKSTNPDMDNPKLRLWAKMISKGRHDDYTNPPQIPLITGSSAQSKKKSSNAQVADALTNAATAIVSAMKSPTTPQNSHSQTSAKFSPMSGAKLRRSCLDDLKSLKELYQDAVLSEAEFTEQKEKILRTLKDI